MTPDDDGKAVADRIQDEHHAIFKQVRELEAFLVVKASADEWVSGVTRRLSGLGEVMAPHFRYERESALYTEAPIKAPHLAGKIERLLGEHQRFLTELGAIIAAARGALDPDEGLMQQLTERVTTLFAELRSHEASENEVLSDAFLDDIGVGD